MTSRSLSHSPLRPSLLLTSVYHSKRSADVMAPSSRAEWVRNSRTEKNSLTVLNLQSKSVWRGQETEGGATCRAIVRWVTISHLFRSRLLLGSVLRELGHVVQDARIRQLGRTRLTLLLQDPTPRVVFIFHEQARHDHLLHEQQHTSGQTLGVCLAQL